VLKVKSLTLMAIVWFLNKLAKKAELFSKLMRRQLPTVNCVFQDMKLHQMVHVLTCQILTTASKLT